MTADTITEIQILILAELANEGGRDATESLYDLVEAIRPTIDEDGEPIDDMDPYETSREEIGALERAGLLDQDDEGMAAGGYSSLTPAGVEMTKALCERMIAREEGYMARLADLDEGSEEHTLVLAAALHTRRLVERLNALPYEMDDYDDEDLEADAEHVRSQGDPLNEDE